MPSDPDPRDTAPRDKASRETEELVHQRVSGRKRRSPVHFKFDNQRGYTMVRGCST